MATLNQQSRYYQGQITRLPDTSGTYQLSVLRTVPSKAAQNFKLYVWQQTDRPDLVAARLLGNPQLWWEIFDINPEIIYPLNIPAGSVLRIPTTPVQAQGTLYQ
jgi:hypothetical protein